MKHLILVGVALAVFLVAKRKKSPKQVVVLVLK